MIKLLFYTLFLCVFTIESVSGKNLFVSPVGSNINNGSINFSYKTIKYAIDQSQEFDTIFLRKGLYNESVTINSKKNITIVSYQNEEVTISPFLPNDNITWEKYTDNIYKTKINGLALQLFLNNNPIMQASYPNMKEELFNSENAANITVSSNKTINFPDITKFGTLKTGYFLGLCSDNIVSIGGNIVNSAGDQLSITDTAFYWKSEFENSYLGKGKGYLIGNIAFLDTPNEWYADGEYLYVYTSNMKELDGFSIRNKLYAFQILNTENINLSNLNIFGGSILVQKSSKCTISNLNIEYPVPFHHPWSGFERFSPYWNGIEVLTVGPGEWTGKGVEIGGENNTLINCHIAHSWGDGATIYGIGNTVENCIIEDCDWIANDCAVLNISGSNHIVSNNTLKNSARSILLNRKLYNSKIIHNDLSYGGTKCTDLGLIYNYDTDGKNTEIAYNFIHDSQSKKNGVGIYIDENNQNHSLHHNIITNCSVGINLNKPCKNTLVYHNTLYNNEFSMGAWGNTGELDNVRTFNNLTNTDKKLSWNYDAFYGTRVDSNYLYTNNIFKDPINNNFELKPNSFAVNTGIKNEYTIDYFGALPDKGAFEYGKTPWKTGSTLILQNKKNEIPYPASNLSLVKNTKDSTLLQWEYVHGFIDSYYVQRKKSGETEYKTIKIVDSTFFQFNDTISELGEFRYQILAKNKYGFATPSNSVEVFKNQNVTNGIFLDAENNDLQNGTTIAEETIGYLDNKDWIAFKQVDFGKELVDACNIRYAVPCSNAWQNIQIRLDSYMGEIVGEHITENTGGWDKFEIKAFPIKPTTGIHDIYVKFRGKFGIGTLDWFQLYNSNGTVKKTLQKDPKCPQTYTTTSEIPVKLFPNPGNDLLRVSFENKELASATVEIYNTIGHKISTQSFTELYPGEIELYVDSKALDLGLKSAFYIIKVNIESESHNQETILKYIRL
jgi:hypothetical protein